MNKAQQMLAKAGFPDTAAGRAAFHKQYPTPESFFQVHGDQDNDINAEPDMDSDDMYKAGGSIHIKPSHKGRFTAYKQRTGKTTEEALHSKDPHVRQMANFARNAAKWKHEDGGPVMYADGGKLPQGILRSRLEAHMSPNEAQSYINKYDAGSMVGDPPPNDKDYAMYGGYDNYINMVSGKSNLERFPKKDPGFGFRGPGSFSYYMDRLKNRNVKTVNPNQGVKDAIIDTNTITGSCESGTCFEFKDGGTVDALQLMGMPTPPMYGMGGPTHYIPSFNFGHVQSANNTYRHGYANGGHVGMYGFGSTIKDLGYGMADMSLGTIGGLTGIQSMQDIVDEDQYSNDKFDDVANFGGKSLSTAANFIPGAQPFLMATRGIGTLANTAFKIDERNYDPSQHTGKLDKIGNFVQGAGNIASSFVNPMGAADTLSKGAKTAMNVGKIAGLGATGINAARDIDKSQGGTYDPTNLLNLGMGVANSGFFGGNTNTSGNFTNTKGAADYTPTMDTPLYAAMGGAVNAPNMMKYTQGGYTMLPPNVSTGRAIVNRYDAGSNVPNQDNLSPKDQYNLFLNAKPVTKYFSNAFPAHPKDGSMDPRGTVTGSVDPQTGKPIEINVEANEANWRLPNKTNFITTKKDTEKIIAFDKNGDGIAKASAMANIARAKLIKDAKAKAQQEQMMQQQDMMMQQQMMPQDIMSAQYGGMVGQYGYGGGVRMYDGGGNTPYADQSMMSAEADRYAGPGLNLQTNPFGFQRNKNPYMQNWNPIQPNNPTYNPTWTNRGGSPPPIEMDMQGSPSYQYENNLTRDAYGSSPTDVSNYTPIGTSSTDGATDANGTPSWFDRNKQDLGTAAGKAIMYGPGLYNVARSFGKPFQMNAADYQIKGKVDPYEEEYVPDYRPYNAAVANLNRMPGSGNLAARTNLFNAMQQQQDDARYKISLANAQRKMGAQQANLGIEGQNLNTAMQLAQFNEQNRAAKRNMLGQGLTDASQAYQFERFNKLSANAMGNIMQHYTVLPDGTMVPKGGYNPAAYNSIYNAGNTPNTFDPSLASPNRYSGGINFTPTKPSFRNK